MLMFALKKHSGMHNAPASYLGFKEIFAALFDMNYWLREFPLSAAVNRFELRCKSPFERPLLRGCQGNIIGKKIVNW